MGAGDLEVDLPAASRWWAQAAARGLAPAQFNLARAYEQGHVPNGGGGGDADADDAAAAATFLTATPLGDEGQAVRLLRAVQLYAAAAQQGLPEARAKLEQLAPEARRLRAELGQDPSGPEDDVL